MRKSIWEKVKEFPRSIILGLILILDFLALDDITTGSESDLFLEYAVLIISGVILGIYLGKYMSNIKNNDKKPRTD